VRKLFSYVLLVSLLSPTGVELLHAIHDSHEIIAQQGTNINEHKFDCQINLISFQDDDFNLLSSSFYSLIVFQNSLSNIIKAEDPEIDNTSTTFLKRGPPTLA